MPKLPPLPYPRLALTLFATGISGFALAAALNQGAAQLFNLPEGSEPVNYSDVDPDADPQVISDADSPSARPAARPRTPTNKSFEVILRRNIFDSTAVYNPDVVVAGGGDCKDSGVKLIATVVADIPEYSSALISVSGGKDSRAQGFVIGDQIAGEGRITSIEQKKVCTDAGGCLCMGTDSGPKPGGGGDDGAAGSETEGITKVSDTKYLIDQSVISGAMGNLESLMTQVRASPHKGPDGEIDGYRLSAIRKGSLLEKLGIKNGDIIKGVNGKPLTSTDAAMSAYQALSSEKNFSFDLTRRSKETSIEYEIR